MIMPASSRRTLHLTTHLMALKPAMVWRGGQQPSHKMRTMAWPMATLLMLEKNSFCSRCAPAVGILLSLNDAVTSSMMGFCKLLRFWDVLL